MAVRYPENETKITYNTTIGLIKMTTSTVQTFSNTTLRLKCHLSIGKVYPITIFCRDVINSIKPGNDSNSENYLLP